MFRIDDKVMILVDTDNALWDFNGETGNIIKVQAIDGLYTININGNHVLAFESEFKVI